MIQDIIDEIEAVLTYSEDLRNGLIKKYRLAKETDADALTLALKAQSENGITQVLRSIIIVTRKLLKGYERDKAIRKIKQLINEAEKLVTLISMFDIHTVQADQLLTFPLNMTLPQEAPGSAELSFARRTQAFPKFRVGTVSPDIVGQQAVISDEIETGINENSVVDYIENKIWHLAFGKSPGKFNRQRLRDHLGGELKAADPDKKNYYFLVSLNAAVENNYLADPKVRAELNKRLPELPIITLKHAPESAMFVNSDRELMAELYKFYQEINLYVPEGQEHA